MKTLRWNILFEDDDLIVIDKPAPYLVLPDRFDPLIPNLLSVLKQKREAVFVNHRIDKETSGLIIFTKNEEAHKGLSKQFENGEVDKHYLSIVCGQPTEDVGLIDLPIDSNSKGPKGMIVHPKGKASQTKYRVLESFPSHSYLEIKTLTGRQHQIRVHMKAIGCPLLCDKLYGPNSEFYLSEIKRKMRVERGEERPLLKRMALHASKLSFKHPKSNEILKYSSDLPKDMKAVIYQMNKLLQK